MLNGWLNLAIEIRLMIIAILGIAVSPFVNWAIYNVCYFPRPISPWGRSRWLDSRNPEPIRSLTRTTNARQKLPIVGWLWLKEDVSSFGKYVWLRPMLIEICLPVFLCWLYWFEVNGGLLPPVAAMMVASYQDNFHLHFVAHAVLCVLMVIATFIDFDERTIPDWITVPGTLFALIGSAMFRDWHLWIDAVDPITGLVPSRLHAYSPWTWPAEWNGVTGLIMGVSCFLLWCFGLADRRLITRRGWKKAIDYFIAAIFRNPSWKTLVMISVLGSVGILLAWQLLGALSWRSLLSSLIGMIVGGVVIWAVRILARLALGVEAMGFGDVTLMAMVGAFVGWQPAWIGFFVAPFFALIFVLVSYILTGDNQAPFGPYLCAGTLFALIFWDGVWNQTIQNLLFVMGFEIGMILLAGMLMLFGMLWIWRLFKLVFIKRSGKSLSGNESKAH